MDEIIAQLKGRFLVMDGPDGAGKTTQLELLTEALTVAGLDVTRAVDPGGTPAGQRIRNILLHHEDLDLAPMCETMLFMASRAQLVAEVVRPAIESGRIVLCDRFISATLAYQGALGIAPDTILDTGRIAVGNTWPDLTIVLDIDARQGLTRVGPERGRLKSAGEKTVAARQLALFTDRMEKRTANYHEQVRRNFQALPGCYPAPVVVVDATGTPDDVHERILATLKEQFVE